MDFLSLLFQSNNATLSCHLLARALGARGGPPACQRAINAPWYAWQGKKKKLNPLHDPINLSGTSTLWLISGLDYQTVKSIISPSDAAHCTKTFFGRLGSLN